MTPEQKKIIEWALENDYDFTLYSEVQNFNPGDDWRGSCAGKNDPDEEIHLIAQDETNCIYGETVRDLADADYLICGTGGSPVSECIQALLDTIFNDQNDWPDTYAQTHGWFLSRP